MPDKEISAMVEGGKATAGPPLGPALGPLGINTKAVVEQINTKTKALSGIKVPVKVIVHQDKTFDIEVGTPPVAALIKKELGLEKGSGEAGKQRVGDLTEQQVKKIAKMKFGSDDKPFTSQVAGTARSMGVTVGEGRVTEEEKEAYEEQKAAQEAEAKEKEASKATTEEGEKEEPKKEEPKADPEKK